MKAGWLGWALLFTAGLAAAWWAAPRRYVVDGISMGPGLLPGDILQTDWLPVFGNLRPPSRFDRRLVRLPDGSTGVKRVVGLPGETIEIADGDLRVAGSLVGKNPAELATMGSLVTIETADRTGMPERFALSARLIRDNADFEPAETTRLLLPVHDAGLAAVVNVEKPGGSITARVGPLIVRWRVRARGRVVVVSGRLDGQAVAVAWPLPTGRAPATVGRSCLPAGVPVAWDVARPWPPGSDEEFAPAVELVVEERMGHAEPSAVIEAVTGWRDILYRPAGNGSRRWQLEPDEVFLLGDFPSGSRDSRQFGPQPTSDLRPPVAGWMAAR
ncbi:MAG: Signal peptidase peptidase [Planctomycetota bacterium]